MSDDTDSHWALLERQSPRAILVAGILLVGYAALNGVAEFTGAAYPTVEDVVGPAGFTLGFVGVLGLYPGLADGRQWLTRIGAVCAVSGAMGFAVISAWSLGRLIGLGVGDPIATVPVLLLFVAVGMGPGFLALGLATLHSGPHSRPVGFLLLAPAAIFSAMLGGAVLGYTPAGSEFAISGAQAIAYLAIGYALQVEEVATARDRPARDVTLG